MILEGIVTTTNFDQSVNVAPMGPIVEEHGFERFLLRPFQTSSTFQNLKRSKAGVLHITDDVGLFVDGAIRCFNSTPECKPAQAVKGFVLSDCCRYFEFEVEHINDKEDRSEIDCRVILTKEVRSFWGFNRAKHAVLEMAILATRLNFMEKEEAVSRLSHLVSAIKKTAGQREQTAFEKLKHFFLQNDIELE